MSDPQDNAETVDEDQTGADPLLSDERGATSFPPDEPRGLPSADADVTDESLAERVLQEEPEVWASDGAADTAAHDDVAADEQLDTIIELP